MQKKVVPMLHVPDVRRTVDWYRGIGFDVTVTYDDHGGGLSFAMVSFGTGEVMFSSGGRPSSQPRREVDLYAYTDDVDDLYDRIKDRRRDRRGSAQHVLRHARDHRPRSERLLDHVRSAASS